LCVPGRPFQPRVMFVSNTGAYPSTFYELHSWVGSLPLQQTLG